MAISAFNMLVEGKRGFIERHRGRAIENHFYKGNDVIGYHKIAVYINQNHKELIGKPALVQLRGIGLYDEIQDWISPTQWPASFKC